MEIKIKLMGVLKDKTPPDGKLDLPEGSRIEDVLRAVGIRVETVSVFTVNGQIVRDRNHELSANDDLAVLPPAGGG